MTGINWGDVPTWLAVAVASVGGAAALYQLRQQGAVLKGEAERNKLRDELLDGQLNDLSDREWRRKREQAECIDVTWEDLAPARGESLVTVINNSRRPITKLKCLIIPDDVGGEQLDPEYCTEMQSELVAIGPGSAEMWRMPARAAESATSLRMLRPGARAGFRFAVRRADCPGGEADVLFTDDIGLDWALSSDLALSEA